MIIKNEFEEELSNLDPTSRADRAQDESVDSATNSSVLVIDERNFGDHFLLEGLTVDENKNRSNFNGSGQVPTMFIKRFPSPSTNKLERLSLSNV